MNDRDIEAQEDELLALASIYSQGEFARAGLGGEIRVSLDLPLDFSVKAGDRNYAISFLPPLLLIFDLPCDYPSTSSPEFILTCQWLSHSQLSAVCRHLDKIWQDTVGSVVLFYWVKFIRDDLLDFLHIQSPLEIPVSGQSQATTSTMGSTAGDLEGATMCSEGAAVCREAWDSEGSAVCSEGAAVCRKAGDFEGAAVCSEGAAMCSEARDSEGSAVCSEGAAVCRKPGDFEGAALSQDPRALSVLATDTDHLRQLLDYDEKERQRVFDGQAHDCGICFMSRLGCSQFRECGHIYCNKCMSEFFVVQIEEGNIHGLTCPQPDCSSTATPSQVKQLVGVELFTRYDRLLLQSTLDRMADVKYCPRPTCAAPVILEPDSTAAVCPQCRYAFCTLCSKTYHGTFSCQLTRTTTTRANSSFAALPRSDAGLQALWEDYHTGSRERKRMLDKRYGKHILKSVVEEAMTITWKEINSKNCPSCGAVIQKDGGCNKMICFACGQHFCWQCLERMGSKRPSTHFRDPNCPSHGF
ncbi:E3 ubiquitin-protein ligase RNF14 isoform X1 [Esox lucius]|uniref:RBR-type E3 ubiquitin transferase n=1 Tax=Esox lucius TaxID=8010 RepID=A0A3P8XP96_ESOLU|nr:E3 ubiquitin-protein ligase RNF14 isoform X1 [Esox lucius]